MSKVYYVAGPMSFRPQFNFPLFDKAAATLRKQGHTVLSPAELDAPEIREVALASPDGDPVPYVARTDTTWGDFLARDVKIIADGVDAIVLLPQWDTSRGARLEAFVGLLCDADFYLWDPSCTYPVLVPASYVRSLVV